MKQVGSKLFSVEWCGYSRWLSHEEADCFTTSGLMTNQSSHLWLCPLKNKQTLFKTCCLVSKITCLNVCKCQSLCTETLTVFSYLSRTVVDSVALQELRMCHLKWPLLRECEVKLSREKVDTCHTRGLPPHSVLLKLFAYFFWERVLQYITSSQIFQSQHHTMFSWSDITAFTPVLWAYFIKMENRVVFKLMLLMTLNVPCT